MYFWNINKLKEDLKEQPLPESESFKYLLASSIVLGLVMVPLFETNKYDVIGALLDTVVLVFGVLYIFRCNGAANGEHLLQRYFSLGWVVSIRWLVLAVIPVFVAYFVVMEIVGEVPEYTTLQDTVLISVLYAGYFLRLGAHFKWVSGLHAV